MSERERSAGEVRISQARCPYCHEEVPRGEEPGVCAGCHALHHRDCLAEHGRCAACGVERELSRGDTADELRRWLTALKRENQRKAQAQMAAFARWFTPRRLTLAALVPCLLIAAGFGLGHAGKPDGGIAWAFVGAALGGSILTHRRGALRGWGVFFGLLAAGFLAFLWLSEHARLRHMQELLLAASFLAGASLLFLAVFRPRTTPSKNDMKGS